jgi:hypothetical protein
MRDFNGEEQSKLQTFMALRGEGVDVDAFATTASAAVFHFFSERKKKLKTFPAL